MQQVAAKPVYLRFEFIMFAQQAHYLLSYLPRSEKTCLLFEIASYVAQVGLELIVAKTDLELLFIGPFYIISSGLPIGATMAGSVT